MDSQHHTYTPTCRIGAGRSGYVAVVRVLFVLVLNISSCWKGAAAHVTTSGTVNTLPASSSHSPSTTTDGANNLAGQSRDSSALAFVTRNGTYLLLGSKPFYFVGFNAYWFTDAYASTAGRRQILQLLKAAQV